jgi:hypothetical protein
VFGGGNFGGDVGGGVECTSGGEYGGGAVGNSMPAHIIPSLMYGPTGDEAHKTSGTEGTLAI